jgi:hypothetical protein
VFGIDQQVADQFVLLAELRGDREKQFLVELQDGPFRGGRRGGGQDRALRRLGHRHERRFAAEKRSKLGHWNGMSLRRCARPKATPESLGC